MQSNANGTFSTTLPDLQSTNAAVPSLWDTRFLVLLNNTVILNRRLSGFEAGTTAIRALQTVADLTGLRSFATPNDGETAYIPFTGVYRYYAADTALEALPWVVRPDSNAGRWHLDMVPRSVLGANSGVATLDSSGFLSQSLSNGSVTAEKLAKGAITFDKLGSSAVDDSTLLDANTVTTASLTQLLGMIAFQIRQVTGKASWLTKPDVSLGTFNQYGARTDKAQSWSQLQTFKTVTVTDQLIIPVR